ncbi:MAG: AtpZ/AtpI family protein [Bacteroidota bacterium]
MAEEGKPKPWSVVYGPFLTLGLQLAITAVAFFFVGRWLDDALGTAPWLMLAGLAVGVAGGLISFLRTAIALGKEQDRETEERRKGSEDEE